MRGRMSRVRRRRAVATVVPRRCARWRRAPHQHGLPWCLVAVHLRFHVFHLRREHAIRRATAAATTTAGHWRATGGIAGRRATLQRVSATGAHDVHVGRHRVHRRRARDRTRGVWRTAHAAGMSRLHVAVLGRFTAAELLTIELVFRLAAQLMGLICRQRYIDETVVSSAGMVLWVIRAQWPILEQILRRGCEISVKEKKKKLERKAPCQLFLCIRDRRVGCSRTD